MRRAGFFLVLSFAATEAVADDKLPGAGADEPIDQTAAPATAKSSEPTPSPDPTAKPATGDVTPAKPAATPSSAEISGYIQPGLSLVHRADAVPRDRWRYGAESSRAGITFSGTPVPKWSYKLELVVAGESNDLVSSVGIVDQNGDGVPDDVSAKTEQVPGLFVERAIVEYAVTSQITAMLGRQRIPFTVQEQSPSTELMFPTRSGPNEVFVQGPDLGGGLAYHMPHDLLVVQAGAFNGTGEPVEASSAHGLVYFSRVDVNPLGEFPLGEAAPGRGPLRMGFGTGLLYYASRHYDAAGFQGAEQRDLRASASFRLAVSGLYVQAEALRRQRTDSLSARPEITTGAYGQASWYVPLAVGVAPQARLGWAAEDQGFDSRTTLWIEGGVAIYPSVSDPDALKIVVTYVGERRITEAEQANGAVVQVQLTW